MNDEELKNQIAIGLDLEAFFDSTAGRKVLERMNDSEELAINQLIDADPEDPKEIRRLQNKIKCSRDFKAGCRELMDIGENAERELNEPTGD